MKLASIGTAKTQLHNRAKWKREHVHNNNLYDYVLFCSAAAAAGVAGVHEAGQHRHCRHGRTGAPTQRADGRHNTSGGQAAARSNGQRAGKLPTFYPKLIHLI
jgi:hypothetical protein